MPKLMRNRSPYEQIAEVYNREQDTHIVLREDENGSMTPVVDLDTQEVVFNPRFHTLLTLFNIATQHKQGGSKAIHHFLLYHLAIRKNMYGKAEELLDLFNKDIDDLCGMIRKEDMQFYEIVAEYQITFILIHEFSHIYYYANPEVLEENRRIRKDNLIWLRKQLDTDKPLLARMLHFFIPSMRYAQEHSFDEAIASLELQEELLCDDAAWHMTYHLLQSNITDSELSALLSAYIVFTLYYIEAQRTLENIYMTDDKKQRQKDLMFDTSRSTVLVNTIWDDVPHETIKQYQSLVNDISRMGRLFLLLPLRSNVEHIGYIRLMSKEKYSLKELKRLDAIYGEVDAKLRGYMIKNKY